MSSPEQNNAVSRRRRLSNMIFEMVVFAMLGAIMFATKFAMEAIPNVHLLGGLIVAYTLAFRVKALIPIYIYVFLNGLRIGFGMWWIADLYIWAVLWALTMLLPRRLPDKVLCVICPVLGALHGLLYGCLCAPVQAVFVHLNWEGTVAWIIKGIPYDAIHGCSNIVMCLFSVPLARLLQKLMRRRGR